MKRINVNIRNNWVEKVESLGFKYHSLDSIYWDESHAYEFTMDEILFIEKATNELSDLCLKTVDYIINNKLYSKLQIPDYAIPHIEYSWNYELPSIYGRFDFSYNPNNKSLKLLEYNADTPTSLLESAVIQWDWLQDFNKNYDQFNSIHEKLISYWRFLKTGNYIQSNVTDLHFTSTNSSVEDIITTEYLRDTAIQAGLTTDFLYLEDIGYNNETDEFADIEGNSIKNIFKLYPWEWMLYDDFGKKIKQEKCNWIEPAWKMIMSNKGFMAILYSLYSTNKYLPKTYFESQMGMIDYCKKPMISREGQNIELFKNNELYHSTDGEYGEEGYIYQELYELPKIDNNYILIGSWLINHEAAGMGIRESDSPITNNTGRFVPHYIKG